MAYATRQDVYALGLPAEVFARPPRRVEGVIPSSGLLQIRSHGLALGAALTLSVLSASTLGAPVAAPPGGLALGQVYGASPIGSDAFQLLDAAPAGNLIASFTDAGGGVLGVLVDSGPDLDAALDAATTIINEYARAHAAPIAAPSLKFVCAYVAARIYVSAHAPLNPAYAEALEGPSWLRGLINQLFNIWLRGAPIQGAVDATPTLADNGAQLVRIRCGDFDLPGPGGSDIA